MTTTTQTSVHNEDNNEQHCTSNVQQRFNTGDLVNWHHPMYTFDAEFIHYTAKKAVIYALNVNGDMVRKVVDPQSLSMRTGGEQ